MLTSRFDELLAFERKQVSANSTSVSFFINLICLLKQSMTQMMNNVMRVGQISLL